MSCVGKKKSIFVLSSILVASLFGAVVRYTDNISSLLLRPYSDQDGILSTSRAFTQTISQQPRDLLGYISVTTQQSPIQHGNCPFGPVSPYQPSKEAASIIKDPYHSHNALFSLLPSGKSWGKLSTEEVVLDAAGSHSEVTATERKDRRTGGDGVTEGDSNGTKGVTGSGQKRKQLKKPLRLHCDLCSIVSSSGQMLGQKAGKLIDQSPCVWRMNNAPTLGFESDVGTRTTVRVVSHTSLPLLLQKEQIYFAETNETIYVIWGPYRKMREDGQGPTYNELQKLARKYPHAKIYMTTQEQMKYCDRIFKQETGKDRLLSGTYLSTGWFTLVLAMEVCPKIHIFGMINDAYCSLHRNEERKKIPYHYYEPGSRDECAEYVQHEKAQYGGHRFITEKAIFAKWAKHHNITFSHPSREFSDTGRQTLRED